MKDLVRAYLKRHGEPEAQGCAEAWDAGAFAQALVIPATGEGAALMRALASVPGPSTLVILVLNARADSDAWAHQSNHELPRLLARRYGAPLRLGAGPRTESAAAPADLYAMPTGALLLIDRACLGHFLPPSQGVGLARKIGVDVALALYHAGLVASPWFGCTDADVVLPPDYFAQMRALPARAAAATFSFVHAFESCPGRERAVRHYEASLRYYVQGLHWAGSPYAFHTVGSTLAVHAAAYAQVRGFPKLLAAEDFYLLNKLRKVGTVVSTRGQPIVLSGRASTRVPFGTGAAVMRGLAGREAAPVYHPHVFFYLRAFVELLHRAARAPVQVEDAPLCAPLNRDLFIRTARASGVQKAIDRARLDTKSIAPRVRALHTWFDAFRTRKLVHYLRDSALPSAPLHDAVTREPFFLRAGCARTAAAELARREQRLYDSSHADAFADF